MNSRYSAALIMLLSLIGFSAGCGGGGISPEAALENANKTNIQRLTNLYVRHQMQTQGEGPEDEESFKSFINTLDEMTKKNVGLETGTVDELFKSDRDSKPFKVNYGVVGSMRGSNIAVVFETDGVDGIRQVGFTSMAIKDVEDDAEYRQLQNGEEVSTASNRGQASRWCRPITIALEFYILFFFLGEG